MNKADLILHPARMQILQHLSQGPACTADLAERLVDVPKSSIYRHMRALLDGGLIEVADTRPVKGTLEKFYRLAQPFHISQADMANFTREDHLRYFGMFLATQLQDFSTYLQARPEANFLADHTGYSTAVFSASSEELDQLLTKLRDVIVASAGNPPAPGRARHKISIITHPLVSEEENP